MISWQIKTFAQLDTDELLEIMRLRQEVFIVEQKCIYHDIDNLDKYALHLIGYALSGHAAKELCVYARIIKQNEKSRAAAIGRVIVSPSFRGRGYGIVLMEKALEVSAQHFPGIDMRISAQAHLEKFYQSIGFAVISEPYDEDGISHIDMVRQADL